MNECSKEYEDEQTNRGKNEEVDAFAYLPDDILLEILKKLPDAFLRYKAKYVCKRWFMISTNRILLDHASFILQHRNQNAGLFDMCLVDIGEAQQGIEVREQNIFTFHKIKSWCNEFLLISIHARRYSVYVFNLITKETLYLPQGEKIYCLGHCKDSCYMSLSFDGFKGVYKVVHLFIDCTARIRCHILILGRDIDIVSGFSSSKWKGIGIASEMKKWECHYSGSLVSVQVQGRYFHWNVRDYKYLMSMDVVKEEIFQTSLPGTDDRMGSLYSIVEIGGFLTLIDGGGVPSSKADIWILKDFQRVKWEKLHSITVPDYFVGRFLGTPLNRVCGVVSERYIIFMQSKPSYGMFSFDLKTGVLKELNIRIGYGDRHVVHSTAPRFLYPASVGSTKLQGRRYGSRVVGQWMM